MKKQGSKTLKLRSETLRALQDGDLTAIAGATIQCGSFIFRCDPTMQAGCEESVNFC